MALGKAVVEVVITCHANCSHSLLVEHNACALWLDHRLDLVSDRMGASAYLQCDLRNTLAEKDPGMRAEARTKRRRDDWEETYPHASIVQGRYTTAGETYRKIVVHNHTRGTASGRLDCPSLSEFKDQID